MMDSEDHTGRRKDLDKELSSYITGIRKRNRKGILGFIKSSGKRGKKKGVELHPEVEAYGSEEKHINKHNSNHEHNEEESAESPENEESKITFWQWLKSRFSEPSKESYDEKDFEEQEDELKNDEDLTPEESEMEDDYEEESVKKGFFSRLFGRIFPPTQVEEELEEASDELAEDIQDMKKIAEIATKAMKLIPHEKLKEFKASEDFITFKEILKKRNLIK